MKFKTQEPDGLIFFSASPGNQEEYIALQLRSGRPYFLFDPQVHQKKQDSLLTYLFIYLKRFKLTGSSEPLVNWRFWGIFPLFGQYHQTPLRLKVAIYRTARKN